MRTSAPTRARAAIRSSIRTHSPPSCRPAGSRTGIYAALGGRRRPRPDSPNAGWENDAFRAYADHALTDAFAAALEDLAEHVSATATAVMCAEGLWWQCHRRLIADRLLAAGWTVEHIAPDGALTEHTLPPFAHAQPDGKVLYPPPAQLFE